MRLRARKGHSGVPRPIAGYPAWQTRDRGPTGFTIHQPRHGIGSDLVFVGARLGISRGWEVPWARHASFHTSGPKRPELPGPFPIR